MYVDWLRGGLLWLEEERIFSMSMLGGEAKELLRLAEGVRGNVALDLRGNSLLWNSDRAGEWSADNRVMKRSIGIVVQISSKNLAISGFCGVFHIGIMHQPALI